MLPYKSVAKIMAEIRIHKGFTLIELMITVAVVCILAAIAYPSYTNYVVRGKRSAAQGFMQSLSSKQEQFLLDNRSYTDTVNNLLAAPGEVSANYTVTITTGTAPPTYTISATASGSQASRDAACSPLTLKQDGTKSPSGCW